MYCGKQKDVSELRVWLKQFDDDVRIELAFLLLRRLAERGFFTEGAKLNALERLLEALNETRIRLGKKAWIEVRNRKENLCVSYVDSEVKSGAATAREFAKRARPGKCCHANEATDWMSSHIARDPILLIIDDFAGTGQTLNAGLRDLFQSLTDHRTKEAYLEQHRILCYLLFAFPKALDLLRKTHPKVQFLAINVLDEELLAFESNSNIFDNDHDRNFAREVMLQIGRELSPQIPLGFGDIGSLICFHNTIPNNSLPVFWSGGISNNRQWKPLFPRA